MLTKDVIFFIIPTVISIIAILVYFINPPASKPDKNLLSIEFNRIAASDTTPFLFKMMEGGFISEAEGFDSQLTIKDEKGNTYGILEPEFKKMWEKWYFKDFHPLGNRLWKELSGSNYINNNIAFLNIKAKTDEYTGFKEYAKYYMCFFYDSTLNEDGSGWINDTAIESVYGIDNEKLCNILNNDPYGFYYTGVTFTNTSDKNINNIKLLLKEHHPQNPPFNIDNMYDGRCMKMQIEGKINESFVCQDKQALKFIEYSHGKNNYSNYIYSKKSKENLLSNIHVKTYEISSLPPGETLFLVINAYQPDAEGLPNKYLYSFSEIEKIEYSISGFKYTEEHIKPLGEKRMGVIKSPAGGIGGQ